MKKILVAVDGSGYSDKALLEAKKIGECFNSEINIIYVVEDILTHNLYADMVNVKDYDGFLNITLQNVGNKILETAMVEFKDYNGKVETLMEKGNPGETIIKVAKKGEYDLIVMGSRGLNAVSRVMIGSVSNKVINHVDRSVLIVK